MNQIKLCFAIAGVVLLSMSLGVSIFRSGISSTSILIALALSLVIAWFISQQKKASREPLMVLKAIANGDTSLGLTQTHPLRNQLIEVSAKLKSVRLDAVEQANYFQVLIQQINVGVIVVNDSGIIKQQNSAAIRLVGEKLGHIQAFHPFYGYYRKALFEPSSKLSRITLPWQKNEHQDIFSVSIIKLELNGKILVSITFQSIYEELKLKEQEAFKQLTQVLTHEVANSILPLSSLAETALDRLPHELEFECDDDKDDLAVALSAISSRAIHLNQFITRFRTFSGLPPPNRKPCHLHDLTDNVYQLMRQSILDNEITFNNKVVYSQLLMVDRSQIEQVLINLITNALEAISLIDAHDDIEQIKQITLESGHLSDGRAYIDLKDSGTGISASAIANIFVPFFTTKSNGSGIGLALAKTIMVQHGGDLIYITSEERANKSAPSNGACFRLLF
ncbi:sensor histidine kinase [Brumicola nitratireducens]|uniref:histidine kinase n=1 Tax=Glaciecola nitratireducens (strain JCM 12485 / KCTC 12276 / FR1064) TaxID=1085623 RepID=G4QN61_GLANF|nr:ATP-binding protein [Glaciecola nitratireducens]AEP31480.1 putative two-component system sensor histidine kinase [Glaciecola nitratireducens FR1064]